MAKASTRSLLRKLRQERNKASLTAEQKQKQKAAAQFVIFGGRRGNSDGRSFDSFAAQHV